MRTQDPVGAVTPTPSQTRFVWTPTSTAISPSSKSSFATVGPPSRTPATEFWVLVNGDPSAMLNRGPRAMNIGRVW
ncbi:MAG: hypothetical protein EA376_00490 [Phycisphaeraceae bacterium]|nr:MAG: hypothetical protein EA376_00490 [Phycisphaeraceae bacterium]